MNYSQGNLAEKLEIENWKFFSMYLFINTASAEEIILALVDGKGQILVKKNIKAKYKQSEKLLLNIDKILKDIKDIKSVIVVKGPGSFTALRIGVVTANTLAWALRIPIIGVKLEEKTKIEAAIEKSLKKIIKFKQVMPEYGMEPNISE